MHVRMYEYFLVMYVSNLHLYVPVFMYVYVSMYGYICMMHVFSFINV